MNDSRVEFLGETWLKLVRTTVKSGVPVAGEGLELLGVSVVFSAAVENDELIREFGDRRMIDEMDHVFFANGSGALGHSYAQLLRGPDGRSDFADIISLLRAEPASKRAVVTLCGTGGGKVPCVNVVQFLVREGSLRAIYFARGQDAFKKFYADALCLAKMTRLVAEGLGMPAGTVSGFIGSSHVYHEDRAAIDDFLVRADRFLLNGAPKGAA